MAAAASKVGGSSKGGRVGRKRKEPDQSKYSGRLAARIHLLRQKSGKSAQEMAEALGIPYSTYATYENGTAEWPTDLTPEFAAVLGIAPRTVYPAE